MKKIISVILICITAGLCCYFITNSINKADHIISVDWDWEVHVTPDTLIISLRVEETAPTTKEAQATANEKIAQIKEIISQYDIQESDIQTTNMNVYEDYDRINTGRVSRWYVASHNLEVKIRQANIENAWVAWKIISEISNIWWVLVNNISYDIYDKSEYYSQARDLAIQKAYQKASDLANYAWVKLWAPVSISESRSYDYGYATKTMTVNSYFDDMAVEIEEADADISLWEIDITLNVSVVYAIK